MKQQTALEGDNASIAKKKKALALPCMPRQTNAKNKSLVASLNIIPESLHGIKYTNSIFLQNCGASDIDKCVVWIISSRGLKGKGLAFLGTRFVLSPVVIHLVKVKYNTVRGSYCQAQRGHTNAKLPTTVAINRRCINSQRLSI